MVGTKGFCEENRSFLGIEIIVRKDARTNALGATCGSITNEDSLVLLHLFCNLHLYKCPAETKLGSVGQCACFTSSGLDNAIAGRRYVTRFGSSFLRPF